MSWRLREQSRGGTRIGSALLPNTFGNVPTAHLLLCQVKRSLKSSCKSFCALDCPSVQLLNLYSSAGTLFGSTWQGLIEYRKSDLELPPAAGYASPNQAIYTVNSELRPLPVGVPGEILIGGASVAAGDGKMDTTTEKFIKSFILRLNSNFAAENWTTV